MTASTHTVLVVDDEPEILQVVHRQLKREPYRVLSTTSPQDALDILGEGQIDVLIADIDMPGINGIELVHQARLLCPSTVRILLTGDLSARSALDAINRGEVHRYITKPWDKELLRSTVREALSRLDELRKLAEASEVKSWRDALLTALEAEHPGIFHVSHEEGTYVIDESRAEALIASLLDEPLKQFVTAGDTGGADTVIMRKP